MVRLACAIYVGPTYEKKHILNLKPSFARDFIYRKRQLRVGKRLNGSSIKFC